MGCGVWGVGRTFVVADFRRVGDSDGDDITGDLLHRTDDQTVADLDEITWLHHLRASERERE